MNRAVTTSDDSFDFNPSQPKDIFNEDERKLNQFLELSRDPIEAKDEEHFFLKEDRKSKASLKKKKITEKRGITVQIVPTDKSSPSLTMLPSPTASFDDNERWHETNNHISFPETPKGDQLNDDVSILFGHSFETISHTTDLEGAAFGRSPQQHHSGIDISLPSLLHDERVDISPIKLDQEEPTDILEPLAFHFSDNSNERYQQANQTSSTFQTSPRPLPYRYAQDRHRTQSPCSNPFYVLRSCSKAFQRCSFVLSYVKSPNPLSVHFSASGSFNHYQNKENLNSEYYQPMDLAIACRRVKTAICAFGGSTSSSIPFLRDRDAIFRGVTNWNHQYESRLHKRYHLNGNHISWEMEEHPPIHVEIGEGIQNKSRRNDNIVDNPTASPQILEESIVQNDSSLLSDVGTSANTEENSDPPKMKYRCKLCGQPKQNHNCPYRQSMQRSIGVSVCIAVNAHEAREPGIITPALTDMNNFVEFPARIDEGIGCIKTENDHVNSGEFHSPSLPVGKVTPPSSTTSVNKNCGRKRKHSEVVLKESHLNTSFVEPVLLCREQYRAVTAYPCDNDYRYPSVPLSFSERKKLSDTLFGLSKEVAHLTDEVASILHQARERELWDLAVAEILTQVIVALYCGEGDKRLDGLQNYLLTIGIAC